MNENGDWERVGRDRRRKEIYLFCFLYRSKSIYRYTHISRDKWLYLRATAAHFITLSLSLVCFFALLACLFVYAMKRTSQSTYKLKNCREIYYQFLCAVWTELNQLIKNVTTSSLSHDVKCVWLVLWWERSNRAKQTEEHLICTLVHTLLSSTNEAKKRENIYLVTSSLIPCVTQ